jgi:RNA polymerase subunit RPABC4/transcription elongation factor Spt4
MPDISSAFSGFFSSQVVQLIVFWVVIYLLAVWLASAFWAFRDMQDRTENPALPYLAVLLVIIFSPFFFVLGVIIYRIIRPAERLDEVYERNLAQEALLAEVEAVRTCRNCDRKVDSEWIICPWCRTRLSRVCPNCERLVGLDWSLCAWCGKDFERPTLAETPTPDPVAAATAAPGAGRTKAPTARSASGGIATGKPIVGR